MDADPDDLATEIASGETERVNDAIDRLGDLDATEQYRIYDELFGACRPTFESDDGYVRQAVVRALREAYPHLEVRLTHEPDGIVDGITLEDTADQRERYVSFLIEALDDEDGRVRTSAADAFGLLSAGLAAAGFDDEAETIREDLETLAKDQPPKRRKHVEESRQSLDRLGPGSPLSTMLSDSLDDRDGSE